MKNALIIFVKNFQAGKVKTRLAAAFGATEALAIYLKLVKHTQVCVQHLDVDLHVFYSDFIEDQGWPENSKQHVQQGADLGARMAWAFEKVFRSGCTSAVIIGSDCLELTSEIVMDAFKHVSNNNIVIGPADDGGYYLLGMTTLHDSLFENMAWSTSAVLNQTLAVCEQLNLHVTFLPTLRDIDEPEDWLTAKA